MFRVAARQEPRRNIDTNVIVPFVGTANVQSINHTDRSTRIQFALQAQDTTTTSRSAPKYIAQTAGASLKRPSAPTVHPSKKARSTGFTSTAGNDPNDQLVVVKVNI
ncbi:uncharacterized protein BJ212DRAFT_707747 [Suillus subaureus]|uniref:Uncharacterized protein n=1 Tax=Suillus subaureus TaxID=48587 RepID=A0A9P7EL19_9AGAM|nr:uncharacterized protein BJ212DRAFT_707747 [Suillus subaureus]KAG1823902.1 hypothetical protein BJ212DRAFT_707747 [Suillus subaureus]